MGHRLERVLVHGRRVERHCCRLCRWDFVDRRFADEDDDNDTQVTD